MSKGVAHEAPTHSHISFFDTVRGMAALSVIGSHYVLAYGLPCKGSLWKWLWTYTPLHIWWDGFAAVSLFFVLSGLVLSLKHFRTSQSHDLNGFNLNNYFFGRICRIWMPYSIIMLASAILQKTVQRHQKIIIIPPTDWILSLWQEPLSATGIVRQIMLFLPGPYSLLPQAWTLSIELILSFLIPIGILLASRSSLWLIFFTLFAIKPIGISHFLFHFSIGILIAKHYIFIKRKMETKSGLRVLSWIGGISLYTIRYTLPVYLKGIFPWDIPEKLIWIMTGLGAALLIISVIGSPRSQAILSYPWLRGVGKISYSIYLLHIAVLGCVTPIFLQLFNNYPSSFMLAWFTGFGVTIGITLLLATLSYKYIEIPSMALRIWIANKVSTPRNTTC